MAPTPGSTSLASSTLRPGSRDAGDERSEKPMKTGNRAGAAIGWEPGSSMIVAEIMAISNDPINAIVVSWNSAMGCRLEKTYGIDSLSCSSALPVLRK